MRAEEINLLFEYNYWANARVLAAAERAGPEVFLAPGALSHGGLRATLVHLLSAEWIWRQRFQEGVSPKAMLSERDFPTVDALRSRWEEEGRAMRAYLGSLGDEDLDRVMRYHDRQGTPFAQPLWQLLLHVVNHGTQTRGEAAVLLTQQGYSPGELDFRLFLSERAGSSE